MNEKDGEHTLHTRDAINMNFRGAMRGRAVEEKCYETLTQMGFKPGNTLFGDSSCPDEINHNGADITFLFQHRWASMFPLSGLAGLPFSGKTGWAAFSSHTPKDGNIVVLFAPHVGIDRDGNVGKVHRDGIKNSTTACGAAVGAYNAVKNNKDQELFESDHTDIQMDCIKALVADRVDLIKGTKNEMASLAYQMFEIVDEFLSGIVDMKWAGPNGKLAILGGIMINCDGDRTDMFLPLKFNVTFKSGKTEDLFRTTFGTSPYVHSFSKKSKKNKKTSSILSLQRTPEVKKEASDDEDGF